MRVSNKRLARSLWTIALLCLTLGTLRASPTFLSRNLLPDTRGLSGSPERPDALRDDGLRGTPQGIVLLGRIRSDARQVPHDPATLDQVLGGMACQTLTAVRPDGGPATQCFPSWAQVAGTLPIETRGTADAAFIFQVGSVAREASRSSVLTIHGGRDTGIVRQVTISVTPETGDSEMPGPAIPLPDDASPGTLGAAPNCDDPASRDLATFYFRAAAGDGGGHLTFVNHVTGLDVDGAIDEVEVLEMGSTGAPKSIRFSGTCDDSLPPCSFSILVENQDDLVRTDDFGIALASRLPDPNPVPPGRAAFLK